MTLKERLNADFKEAMKNKEKVRKETISFVRAAIKSSMKWIIERKSMMLESHPF